MLNKLCPFLLTYNASFIECDTIKPESWPIISLLYSIVQRSGIDMSLTMEAGHYRLSVTYKWGNAPLMVNQYHKLILIHTKMLGLLFNMGLYICFYCQMDPSTDKNPQIPLKSNIIKLVSIISLNTRWTMKDKGGRLGHASSVY
mgnify:CR=1 FL=1